MKKQPYCTFLLAGLSLTSFGAKIPSPFCSLTLNNSETDNYTSWELKITVGGDSSRQMNIAAFEALIYSAAQTKGYSNASGIPVSFIFGWLDETTGSMASYASYQGWTLKYNSSTTGRFLVYTLTGYASQILKANTPVFNFPQIKGRVQPSAVVEGVAKALHVTDYYELDIDHCDAPVYISCNAHTSSLNSFIRGEKTGEDDYDTFPGLLPLAKSYNTTRDAAGLEGGSKLLSSYLNNGAIRSLEKKLKASNSDLTPQCSTFSYWIDEPTMTQPGILHFKETSSIIATADTQVLKYGTSDSNILSISGSYDGVAYNMSDMNFSTLGFSLDETGETIANKTTVTNSWSNSLAQVYQTAGIINDINALATQFSGNFTVTIAGTTRGYTICQPVSLILMSGNTLSPMSGIYNIKSVSHTISNTFITTLTLQRLSISSANQVALSSGIYMTGSSATKQTNTEQTRNIISTGKVNLEPMYPTWRDVQFADSY